ncbi:hypothetical protein GCM10007880_57680 [Mesorhizobium amorphae]|nr:hypothetical protein GCM10007880_57680 [Mesorhizobium amorphae]
MLTLVKVSAPLTQECAELRPKWDEAALVELGLPENEQPPFKVDVLEA